MSRTVEVIKCYICWDFVPVTETRLLNNGHRACLECSDDIAALECKLLNLRNAICANHIQERG